MWFFTSQKSRQRGISRGQTTDQQKRGEDPEIDPHRHVQLFVTTVQKQDNKRKLAFLINDTEAIR